MQTNKAPPEYIPPSRMVLKEKSILALPRKTCRIEARDPFPILSCFSRLLLASSVPTSFPAQVIFSVLGNDSVTLLSLNDRRGSIYTLLSTIALPTGWASLRNSSNFPFCAGLNCKGIRYSSCRADKKNCRIV